MTMTHDQLHTHGPDELAMLRAECYKWHKAYDRVWEERMRFADRAIELEKENAELKAEIEMLKKHIANGDVSRITWIDEVAELKEERRWRKCSEEMPTNDMEGNDFIVSNGFYSVICEWRGYWNNEPFMGDINCDTVKYWTFAPKEPEEYK